MYVTSHTDSHFAIFPPFRSVSVISMSAIIHQLFHHYYVIFSQSLLDEPNPNSPANSQAAQLYQENKREYEKRVTAIVEQSWVDVWASVMVGAFLSITLSSSSQYFSLPFLPHLVKTAIILEELKWYPENQTRMDIVLANRSEENQGR